MASANQMLVCRRCDVPAEKVEVEGRQDRVRCPACGHEADLHVAIEAAGRQIVRGEFKSFQDRMVRSTRGSKHVDYRPGRIPSSPEPDFVFR